MGELRSNEEIEAQIKKGKEFIEKHPYSMFGDNNVRRYELFLELVEKARNGVPYGMLERFIDILSEEEYGFASDVIDWLFQEGFEGEDIYG